MALTCSAPRGWKPGAPLLPHRPPYPTEDLIRQSALFSLMTAKAKAKDAEAKGVEAQAEEVKIEQKTTAIAGRRGRKAGGDKAKLLDLDLNPDM